MRTPSVLLQASLLWLVFGVAHSRSDQPSAPSLVHKHQRAALDMSNLPPEAQSRISATLGRDDPNYAVRVQDGRTQAKNVHQSFTAEFTSDGVAVRAGAAHWRMALSAYGYGSALKAVEHANPRTDSNRVEYRRGSITEWYVNGPAGLEQGFTIKRAPQRKMHGQQLVVALSSSGNLIARADAKCRSL